MHLVPSDVDQLKGQHDVLVMIVPCSNICLDGIVRSFIDFFTPGQRTCLSCWVQAPRRSMTKQRTTSLSRISWEVGYARSYSRSALLTPVAWVNLIWSGLSPYYIDFQFCNFPCLCISMWNKLMIWVWCLMAVVKWLIGNVDVKRPYATICCFLKHVFIGI